MSDYKFFLKGLGAVGLVNILIGISAFILIPILSRNLTITDFGIYNQILVTLSLISGISTLSLPLAIMRFLSSSKDKNEDKEIFYSIFFILCISTILICIIFYLLSPFLANLLFEGNIEVVRILGMIIFINSFNLLLINYFRANNSIKFYSIFLFLQCYLNLLFIAFMAISGNGIVGVAFGSLFAQIILFIIMFLLIFKELGFIIPNFNNFKTYTDYSVPLIPGYISYWVVESSDRYLIGILLGSAFVGYYSPAYMLGSVISLMVMPFPSMLLPMLSRYYDQNDFESVKIYFEYSIKLFLGIGIPSVFGLSLLSFPLLLIISNFEIASNGFIITPIIALGSLIFSVYLIFVIIISLEKKTKIISIIWFICSIVNIIGNLLLIPIFGIVGAALITFITYTIALIFVFYFTSRYIKIKMDLKFISKSIFSSVLMSLCLYLLNPMGLVSILISIFIAIIIYSLLMFILKSLTTEEINFIKSLIWQND